MVTMTASGPKVSSSEDAELLACRRSLEFAVDARVLQVDHRGR